MVMSPVETTANKNGIIFKYKYQKYNFQNESVDDSIRFSCKDLNSLIAI